MISKERKSQPSLPGEPGHPLRGVSVFFLQHGFGDDISRAGLPTLESRIYEIEEKVIRGKGPKLTCPRDEEEGVAYVDALEGEDFAGAATHMLSYTWAYKCGDIIGALGAFCISRGLDPKRTYIWICCLCINQHRVKAATARGETVPFEKFKEEFESRVKSIGKVLALMEPWRAPRYITRVWCVFELHTAVHMGEECELVVLMPPLESESYATCVSTGEGSRQLWDTLKEIRIEDAQATIPEDKVNILRMVEEGPGFEKLNLVVREKLQAWFAEAAESHVRALLQGPDAHEASEACGHIADLHIWQGWLPRAMQLLQDGLEALATAGRSESNTAAYLKKIVGIVHFMQGDLEKAHTTWTETIQLLEVTKNIETEDGANTHMNVGCTLDMLGDFDGAKASFSESLKIRKALGTVESNKGALLLTNLGAAQGRVGELDEATKTLDEALRIRNLTATLETPDGAFLLDQMAFVQDKLKQFDAALSNYNRAIDMRKKCGTQQTNDGALSMAGLGLVQMHLGDFKAALASYEEAKAIREELGIMDKPDGQQLLNEMEECSKALTSSASSSLLNFCVCVFRNI